MRKIIFITREGYALSGARIRCHGFAKQLSKFGIQSEVFSFADDLKAKFGEEEKQLSLSDKLRLNVAAFKRLAKENKDCVFFLQRLNYHSLAPLALNLLRKNKLIFDCDDWNIRENYRYFLKIWPSSKMEYFTKKVAKRADIFIAASRFLEEYFGPFNKNTFYLPTGVDTQRFTPGKETKKDEIIFSWTGTVFHPQMHDNLTFILDCFSTLRRKYSNIRLYLAGRGLYYNKIGEIVGKSRLLDKVMVFPWIHPDNIPEHLNCIDIGLLPLTENTYFNKSKSPTKLFEYMAMAKPTVCSRVGEAESIISEGKTGLTACGKDEFVSQMERLIKDADLRRTIGTNAKEEIEKKYSLTVLGQQLHAIVRNLENG
ncbi:MAG: glycosyltransferase family 4 protein [Candidatus Omnitrophota bacterium]